MVMMMRMLGTELGLCATYLSSFFGNGGVASEMYIFGDGGLQRVCHIRMYI